MKKDYDTNLSFGYTSGYTSPSVAVGLSVFIALLIVGYFFAGSIFSKSSGENIYLDHKDNADSQNSAYKNEPGAYYVYFNNSKISKNDCASVFGVPRKIENYSKETGVLLELLKGPTDEEKENGLTSLFSEATTFALNSLSISGGVAAVNMADISAIIPEAKSDCGRKSLISSVEKTLYQFDNINKVVFAINGNPKKFYDWVGMGCNEENNNCDPSLFR